MFDSLSNLVALKDDRRGVTAVEYALIAALMAGFLVTIFTTFSGALTAAFGNIGTILITHSAA